MWIMFSTLDISTKNLDNPENVLSYYKEFKLTLCKGVVVVFAQYAKIYNGRFFSDIYFSYVFGLEMCIVVVFIDSDQLQVKRKMKIQISVNSF